MSMPPPAFLPRDYPPPTKLPRVPRPHDPRRDFPGGPSTSTAGQRTYAHPNHPSYPHRHHPNQSHRHHAANHLFYPNHHFPPHHHFPNHPSYPHNQPGYPSHRKGARQQCATGTGPIGVGPPEGVGGLRGSGVWTGGGLRPRCLTSWADGTWASEGVGTQPGTSNALGSLSTLGMLSHHGIGSGGSAFLRVLPNDTSDYHGFQLPHTQASDVYADEKLTQVLAKTDTNHLFDDLSESILFSEQHSEYFKGTPESELPIKKRKARFTDSKIGLRTDSQQSFNTHREKANSYVTPNLNIKAEPTVSCFTEPMSYTQQEQALSLGYNYNSNLVPTSSHCQPTRAYDRCLKCSQMHNFNTLAPVLTGEFIAWSPLQVQYWLKTELEGKYPHLPSHSVCSLLQKLEGQSGRSLSTFSMDQFDDELMGRIDGYDFVWDLIADKIESDKSHKSFNYLTPNLSRDIGKPSQMMTFSRIPVNTSCTSFTKKKKPTDKPRRRRDKCVGQLWEFVYNLLENEEKSIVSWEDKEQRLFRIVNTEELARRWGEHKGNNHMTYANMSRTMRYYREGKGAFIPNDRKRVYGFGPKADFQRFAAKVARK